jgi:esterase/lipase superfamily enzyme
MISQLNENNKSKGIQAIISIVRVSKYFSKMLVLSGVFNTRILVATNYTNQDYMRVNYRPTLVFTLYP